MKVSDAVLQRSSIRAFTTKPIQQKVIKELLEKSARAANGGNLQPWKIFVLNEDSMNRFLKFQLDFNEPETSAYDIYPHKLKEPYRTSRFELGEQMYGLLGIGREDKEGRIKQVMKNFEFFGAPAAIFCFVDKQMGPPQWSDLGMFLQTFMLLATEAGIDTCAQEAWSMKQESVSSFVRADAEDMLFCGLAIGYRDKDAVINGLRSERRPLDEWATFL
jgi:nitroreductase|tara:strand:- start:166 stop:819 length:654 start_codon:yes stop_codon:yes gene_type:complete